MCHVFIIRCHDLFKLSLLAAILWVSCQNSIPTDVRQAMGDLPEEVDFNFHIRPLLADRCYKCHGPDDEAREANLRLDLEEGAFSTLEGSAYRPFVPGNLRRSQAWQRIISPIEDFMMPPPQSHLNLSDYEKALIASWIQQGAKWKDHWSFVAPERPLVPEVPMGSVFNEIDQFVQSKLMEKDLTPSEMSAKEVLIRRVTLDLTGLPPTLEEIDAYHKDTSAQAYEKVVDRLLRTDAHAERLTMEWLDVARYGDTQGLHMDAERNYWPWRDWVLSAFKSNMPYDTFVLQQMAGDLLPNPGRDQILATAFHRNHPISSEGGVPDEEFRQKYVQDRTNTTATAFLGLTLECASCHDHKFDPVSQKEYYQMSAFFNNLDELGLVNEASIDPGGMGPKQASGPVLLLPDSIQEIQMNKLARNLERVGHEIDAYRTHVISSKQYIQSLPKGMISIPEPEASFAFDNIGSYQIEEDVVHRIQNNQPIDKIIDRNPYSLACGEIEVVEGRIGSALRSPAEMDLVFLKHVGQFDVYHTYSAGCWLKTEKTGQFQTIVGNSGAMGNGWRGWDFYLDTLNRLSLKLVSMLPQNYLQVTGSKSLEAGKWYHVFFTYDGSGKASGVRLFVDGESLTVEIDRDHLYGTIQRRWRARPGWPHRPLMVFRSGRYHTGENGVFTGSIDQLQFFDQELSPLEIAKIFYQEESADQEKVTSNNDALLAHHLLRNQPAFSQLTDSLRTLVRQMINLNAEIPEVMVMKDQAKVRKTYVLDRGQYDAPTEEVFPSTPAAILAFDDSLPQNRLGLALWIIDKKNPLTARVIINRYWQMMFGRGIVETSHDFGTQGALPTHSKLLDWLAMEFRDSGWDLRQMLKKMAMSHTYRQSSKVESEALERDPRNLWLSRAPNFRLSAEMIRDNALASSGLLNFKWGGPSVKPNQPDGIWDYGGLVSGRYRQDTAGNQYRRSLYTYIRRTSPHPAMVAFDAPNRTVCTVRRESTNSPIQALVLLNDPQFVEAAKVLAERMQVEGGPDLSEQLTLGFRLVTSRHPSVPELAKLEEQFDLAYHSFQKNNEAIHNLLSVGDYAVDKNLSSPSTAALTIVANTLLNHDESYHRR